MELATAAYLLIFLLSVASLGGRIMTWLKAKHVFIFVLSIAFLYDQITTRIPSRLHQAPKLRFGLVPVGANNSQIRASGVDIVFVHGLGSNPDTTWHATRPTTTANALEEAALDSQQFVNWVSDFLPDDFPPAIRRDIRMFFYNYDSYWKRDAVYTRLANLGNELLEHIREIRESETERSRDLIFVGYSYGGLVVKQALILAQANSDLKHIAEHTKAIIFLGTPHRGSSFSAWGWLAAQALQPLGSNPFILANLEYDSTYLLDLHRVFAGISRDDWHIFNLFEQRPTQIFRLWFIRWQQFCVREQSATYEGSKVRNIGLPVDHSGLNKFGSRSESYQVLLSKLIEVTTSPARSVKHYYSVPLETVRTYTERMELSDELERKLRIRHEEASVPYAVALHGLGGAGKSQLALDYAKKYKDRYNPILWIDATDEEAVRSSFQRCAAELRLPEEHVEKQGMVLTDARVQAVLRWLRDRTEAEDEWLVIVDNADDISWGLQKIMPKGKRGSLIITSRDESVKLVTGTCERVHISIMSPVEGVALLLQHLQLDAELASKDIQQNCNEVARKLGYLALAIDVAGAYIGNDYVPEQALSQYLADFDRHRNELLQMDVFRGLLPTQKTVWTVWDTTLEKITKEHAGLQPEMLLTFLAQFKGSIVQDEIFRLASLGMAVVDTELEDEEIEGMPAELRQYSLLDRGEWDSFQYRQSRDVLIRYSLLQRVEGQWAGVTMHSLVQWRAMQSDPSRPWRWWYLKFVLAACCQMTEGQSEFRRHLLMHLQDVSKDYLDGSKDLKQHESFIGTVLGKIYYEERLLDEAKKLFVEVIETHKTKLGADYPDTLTSMDNLASTYTKLGQWEEAEKLELYVIETRKTKLGADHPDTLISMDNLALIYQDQGRWEEAEKLELYIMETRETKLGADHLDTLTSMDHLAVTYGEQGRWKEAEKLLTQVIKTRNIKIGTDHFDTITSLASLAIILWNQGRWDEAEKLLLQVMETCKIKLGKDHPETLISINNYARLLWYQGRRVEAEKLLVQVVETFKTKLGDGHPDTLSSINNLATLYDAQGRWNEAEELLVLVVEARKTKLGVDHPNTLASMNNLASLYKNQGRREEAEKLLISVVETIETKLGAIHPNTLTSMANLALIYQDQSRWKEAEELNIKVIEARKTNLGEDHLDTLTSISNLAMTFESQGRLEEAEKLQVQVIKSFKIKLGADHPDTLTSIANLASTYWKQGRWEEAKELEVQVMEARKTKLGEDHPDTLMSMHKVALTWKDQERHADALALMKACAEARHRVLGPENPHTLSSLAAVELWSR